MANTFIKASFMLGVTASEAELLRIACDAANQLASGDIDAADRAERFAGLGPAFAAAFPATGDDPFGGFLAIFDDPEYPALDCRVEIREAVEGWHDATIYGDQINVTAVAELLFRICKSALPCGFEYAIDCDRPRPGELGGGYVAITASGIEHGDTSTMLERVLGRATEEGADGFVLATCDPEHGMSFWNTETGFGRLTTATVFSEGEAARYDKPIADDEPEWLALPAPLKL